MELPATITLVATAAALGAMLASRNNCRERAALTTHERRRIEHLRRCSVTYALLSQHSERFESLARWLPECLLRLVGGRLRQLGRSAPWTPQEWAAVRGAEGFCAAALAAGAYHTSGGSPMTCLLIGFAVVVGWPLFAWTRLRSAARQRMAEVRGTLPFAIDAIGLMMKSGAGVLQTLQIVADSYGRVALGEELAAVVADVRRGQPLGQSLTEMKERLNLPEIDEFVMIAGCTQELGASVADSMLDMATRMRERRASQIETDAGKAQVKLHYPAMVLLLVCIVTLVAPFVAPAWGFFTGHMN